MKQVSTRDKHFFSHRNSLAANIRRRKNTQNLTIFSRKWAAQISGVVYYLFSRDTSAGKNSQ